nr:MAG TPA: hypothetical protein [Caudoviricetes sp.]
MNLTNKALMDQALTHMKEEVKVSFYKAPGLGEEEQVSLEGSQPCLFSAACTIVRAVVKNELPERREDVLELVKDTVLEGLKDEGAILEKVDEEQKEIFVSCKKVNGKVATNVHGTIGDVMTLTTALLMKIGSSTADAENLNAKDVIEVIASTAIENISENGLGH